MKEYLEHVADLRADYPEFADSFGRSDSLENVLVWMKERGFPPGAVDMVSQDEFSYDFLIRLAAEDRWLVFGVN
ncbi:MAG: hypothetical protein JNM56_08985 [Planctomycetia bacterium]|nr:hypothetical protein [Planctomycetia bacterium]